MQETVLTKIVADKAAWIAKRKAQQPLERFQHRLTPSTRDFYQALSGPETVFILECKKASPSKGVIREDFDPANIADIYKHYAAAISVLTDEKYFHGSFDYLTIVSERVTQPVLCKDFIVDAYQIYLARLYQADACLLMLSVLSDETYLQLASVAHSLNMGVLTEVSNEAELERAIALKAKVVGINNRNLRDLSITLDRTRQLAPRLPEGVTVISESGINNYGQVRELSQYAKGFLIGSALMGETNLELAVRRVLLGENKVCGLTREEDARAAFDAGAIYGGLIFVPTSLRYVNSDRAAKIMAAAPLRYVGVFRNQPLSEVSTTATALQLAAIQLHGDEDQAYISALREMLPDDIAIWKALSVDTRLPERDLEQVDKYLFDNGQGGSGQAFDWDLLADQSGLGQVLLAGGLNADNCLRASQAGCAGLDFNSGVESAPGIKDANKLAVVFRTLRAY